MSLLNIGVASGNALYDYFNQPDQDTLNPNNIKAVQDQQFNNASPINPNLNQGNLLLAAENEDDSNIVTNNTVYTNLEDTLKEGFDISKLSKEDALKLQQDLMNAGFDLPNFGADGDIGPETMDAWDKYYNSKSPGAEDATITDSNDTLLSVAVENENINSEEGAIDQNADNTITESNLINSETGALEGAGDDEVDTAKNNEAAMKKKKADLVQSYFSNMDFGSYSNPFAKR